MEEYIRNWSNIKNMKRLRLDNIDIFGKDELHIYFSTNLIAIHKISDKKMNYLEEHYKELLSVSMKKSEDIDMLAMDNLNQLDCLLNLNGGTNE